MKQQINNNKSYGNQAPEVIYKRAEMNLPVLIMRMRMKMRIRIRMRIKMRMKMRMDGGKINGRKDEVVVVVRGYKSE